MSTWNLFAVLALLTQGMSSRAFLSSTGKWVLFVWSIVMCTKVNMIQAQVSNYALGIDPRGILFGPDNTLFISNMADNSITSFSFDRQLVTVASGFGTAPVIAMNGQGELFAGDPTTNVVYKLSLMENTRTVFASGFTGMDGMAFDNHGTLFVADRGGNRILNVTSDGNVGVFITDITAPKNIAFNSGGLMYVLCASTHAIQTVSRSGVVGLFKASLTTFSDITVDQTGNIITSDYDIIKYSPSGEQIGYIKLSSAAYYLALDNDGVLHFTGYSDSLRGIRKLSNQKEVIVVETPRAPTSIAVDFATSDSFILSNTHSGRISVIKISNCRIYSTILKSSHNWYHSEIAVSPSGVLYVHSNVNDNPGRVYKIGKDGNTTIVATGGSIGSIAFDSKGSLFVVAWDSQYQTYRIYQVSSTTSELVPRSSPLGSNMSPQGLIVDDLGQFWFSYINWATSKYVLLKISQQGTVLYTLSNLSCGSGLAYRSNHLYASCGEQNSVAIYNVHGSPILLSTITDSGFASPSGLAFKKDGSLLVTNSAGSNSISVINFWAPSVIQNPTSVNATVDTMVIFTAICEGYLSPSIQWQTSRDGMVFSVITGAVSSSLSFAVSPNHKGITYYRAQCSNQFGVVYSQTASLTVNMPLVFTSSSLATFTVGVTESFALSCSGFPLPSRFVAQNGLPVGFTIEISTGIIAALPVEGTGGSYVVPITASNTAGHSATHLLTIIINEAVKFENTTSSSVEFQTGQFKTITLHVNPQRFPIQTNFEVIGVLPEALDLSGQSNNSVSISGTPRSTAAGIYTVFLRATNGIPTTQLISIIVKGDPSAAVLNASSLSFVSIMLLLSIVQLFLM